MVESNDEEPPLEDGTIPGSLPPELAREPALTTPLIRRAPAGAAPVEIEPEEAAPVSVSAPIGTVIHGYRIDAELGHGGMGVVYLAWDIALERQVALKMIAPWRSNKLDAEARFKREGRLIALVRNNYVVQVYWAGVHEGSCFFAMEYVRGRTLRHILNEHAQHNDVIPIHRTLTILNLIAQGIDAVHAVGIVHRDVKPSNVVIEEDTGRPVLVDFGLAVPPDDPAAAMASGSAHYMAPEQAGLGPPGSAVTSRTDIYALGVMAYEMLSGRLPFTSTDVAQLMRHHARRQPPPLSSIRPELAVFEKAIARALAKAPDDRYPSCTAFAEVLASANERWVNSRLPTLAPPPPTRSITPVRVLAPAPAPAAEKLAEHRLTPVPDRLTPDPGANEGEPAPRDERPFRALVVDDSPVFRKYTVQATRVAIHRVRKSRVVLVEGASSGVEALERAGVEVPDLVLLDFDMPGLDGLNTLSCLRALPGGGRARVVVVSGRVRPDDRWRFEVLGVRDFVLKPIDFYQLVERIEAIAKRYEESESGRLPLA